MLLTNGQDDWYILTENHSEDYIFYIEPSEISAENFCFLHMSDTEIENIRQCIFMPDVQKAVTENKPAFLINTGDLCRADGVKASYQTYEQPHCGLSRALHYRKP